MADLLFILIAFYLTKLLLKGPSKDKPPKAREAQPEQRKSSQKSATKTEILGKIGEDEIVKILSKFPKIVILRNLYVPKISGGTAEIDIVAITLKGIIVIESKNYDGWIFGTDTHKFWTKTIPNGNKYAIDNPIHQNKTHVDNLARFLQLELNLFTSLIVFGKNSTLKSIDIHYHRATVITVHDLLDTIQCYFNTKNDMFTLDMQEEIVQKLNECCNVSDEMKRQHIENLQNKYQNSGVK